MGTRNGRIPAVALSCALAAWLGAFPAVLEGQVHVSGKVVDSATQRPVEGVAVTLLDAEDDELATDLSNAAGQFSFLVSGRPRIHLRTERVGYLDVETPELDLDPFRSVSLEVRVRPGAVEVAPLEVVAGQRRNTSPVHDGFEHRKDRGFGHYITREEVQERDPVQVTDLFRSVPGVHLTSSGRGSHAVVTTSRGNNSFAGQCPAQIYIDNFHVNRADGWTFRIDDVVAPDDVHGIEVYRGLSTVPAQFLSPEADCGVIAIWTRRSPGTGP